MINQKKQVCEENCTHCAYTENELAANESVEKRRKLANIFYALQFDVIPNNSKRLEELFKYQAQTH